MKITFYSENDRDGKVVDWPVVPRVGEMIHFNHRGGTDILAVMGVFYYADTNGNLTSIGVDLEYPGHGTYLLHNLGG